jgi:septal ring factor EnvC (AmiA/AmiB activator)
MSTELIVTTVISVVLAVVQGLIALVMRQHFGELRAIKEQVGEVKATMDGQRKEQVASCRDCQARLEREDQSLTTTLAETKETLEKQLQAQTTRLDRALETMPKEYVLKDDYVRALTSFDRKLDKLVGMVSRVRASLKRGETPSEEMEPT